MIYAKRFKWKEISKISKEQAEIMEFLEEHKKGIRNWIGCIKVSENTNNLSAPLTYTYDLYVLLR